MKSRFIFSPPLFSLVVATFLSNCATSGPGEVKDCGSVQPGLPESSDLLSGRPRENPSFGGSGPMSRPEDGAYNIVTYNFNHIWGGKGYSSRLPGADAIYRSKLTLKGKGGRIFAEVFFIDDDSFDPGGAHYNPKSAKLPSRGYFFLYFPASSLAGTQGVLAQPKTTKNLVYYDHEWAIESVGDVDAVRPGN